MVDRGGTVEDATDAHSVAAAMLSPIGYATNIGRVGALAVALGIGAAVATGHGIGVARADTGALLFFRPQ